MKNIFASLNFNKSFFFFLLPVFFVFHGYTENFPLVSLKDVLELFAVYMLLTIVLIVLGTIIFKNGEKISVFTLILLCFHFFFGSLHDASKYFFNNIFFNRYIFILPAVVIGLLLLIIFLKRTNKNFSKLIRFANILFLVLIVVEIVQLSIKIFSPGKKTQSYLPATLHPCDTCAKPDIYLIVSDEYAGQQELTELFGYDNSDFENELENRGFHIIDSSRSNYNYTFFSLASMFQLNYLQNIEGRNFSKQDRNTCYKTINQNIVTQFFKNHGYEIKNYSVFNFDNKPVISRSHFFKTGKDLITAQTFVGRIDRDVRFNMITRFKIKSEMETFAKKQLNNISTIYEGTLEEASKQDQQPPRFIYTHLMMPHYPYYFDAAGNRLPLFKILEGNQNDKKDYIGYLQYSNKKFLNLIDHILKSSKQPPIIIFMSDHGFRHYGHGKQDYQFMNFNAVYFPNKNYGSFYTGMSNINQFRVLLNTQFNQQLPLLKDSVSFLHE